MIRSGLLAGTLLLSVAGARAQEAVTASEPFRLGGLAYMDYFYVLESPAEEEVDLNGFVFRRLYLTSDFRLSDAFSGRARLEASNERLVGDEDNGVPYAFVKDLYLRWQSEPGHRVTFGVTAPPAFSVQEGVWNFRGLERTVMDFFGIVSSRDFGVLLDGPVVADRLDYLFMVGNNNSIRIENNKHKRVYGQLSATPNPHLAFTLGGDYARIGGDRERLVTAHAFAAYCLVDCTASTDRFRIGAEAFWQETGFAGGPDLAQAGISVWTWYYFSEQWGAVARADQVRQEEAGGDVNVTLLLGGIVFQPHAQVRLIPNALYVKRDADENPELAGRFTVDFSF